MIARVLDVLVSVPALLCALVGFSVPSPARDELTAEAKREQDREFRRYIAMRARARRDAA